MKTVFVNVLLLTTLVVAAETSYTVNKSRDGMHQITLQSDEVKDVTAAQQLVMERAIEICGDYFVVLGKYTFSKREPLNAEDGAESTTFELAQQLTCEAEAVQKHSGTNNADAVFEPPEELVSQAELAFSEFTGFLNDKKYKSAYGFLTVSNQQISPYKSWRKKKKSFRKQAGGAGEVVEKKLTWYQDPPDAASPGVYVAFDYTCVYPKLKHCSGVLIFHQAESGEFKVIREEINMMDKKTAESLADTVFAVKPFKTADISSEQWQSYYQLAVLKYGNNVLNSAEGCTTQVGAKDISANIYFTQACHPAHPAWVTLYIEKSSQGLHLGQIGYFAGDEQAFVEMFAAFTAYREHLTQEMQQ